MQRFGIGQNFNPHAIRTKIEHPLTTEEREKWYVAKQPRKTDLNEKQSEDREEER